MERSADDGDKPPAAVLKGTITAARSREASQSAGDCSSCMHCAQGRCTTSRSAGVTRGGGGNNEGRNLRSAPFVGAADDKRDSAPGERTPPPVHIDGRPADNQQAAACHSANLLRGTRSSAVTYGPSGSRPARKLSCAPARRQRVCNRTVTSNGFRSSPSSRRFSSMFSPNQLAQLSTLVRLVLPLTPQ